MFSSFVSNMTSSMTYLTKLNYDKRQQREQLIGYMNARRLSLKLREEIINSLNSIKATKRRPMAMSDVRSLSQLPPSLKARLHGEIHVPVLNKHSLFNHLCTTESAAIGRICHRAMT